MHMSVRENMIKLLGFGPVTPKSVPPKIGPAGPILAEKLVPQTIFAAKIGPAGLILAAKIGPPLPKSVPYKSDSFS